MQKLKLVNQPNSWGHLKITITKNFPKVFLGQDFQYPVGVLVHITVSHHKRAKSFNTLYDLIIWQ